MKLPVTNGDGFVYASVEDIVRFNKQGKPFVYISQRNASLELDGNIFTPQRYEAMLHYFDRNGYSTIVDATHPGFVKHGNEIVYDVHAEAFDEDSATITTTGQAVEGLSASLAAAGFQVKAPQ